jgi:hypothetical protein
MQRTPYRKPWTAVITAARLAAEPTAQRREMSNLLPLKGLAKELVRKIDKFAVTNPSKAHAAAKTLKKLGIPWPNLSDHFSTTAGYELYKGYAPVASR